MKPIVTLEDYVKMLTALMERRPETAKYAVWLGSHEAAPGFSASHERKIVRLSIAIRDQEQKS